MYLVAVSCNNTVAGEWEKIQKQHDSFLLHANNSLLELGMVIYFSWANIHVEHQALVFDLFCVLFFLTSDQISILFSVIFILCSLFFFLCILSSAFSLSNFLSYINTGLYCILKTLLIIVSILRVSSPWKIIFLFWYNYHLCFTFTLVYVHLTHSSPGDITP